MVAQGAIVLSGILAGVDAEVDAEEGSFGHILMNNILVKPDNTFV